MKRPVIIVFAVLIVVFLEYKCCVAETRSNLTPFPNNEGMRRIVKRNELQHDGHALAKQGLYDKALVKYELAMDPSLLNREGDKDIALCSIRNIYKYQGKFDEALDLNEKYILPLNPEKDSYIDASRELRALIMARDTKNNKPIYYYINYIKNKYGQYLPPKGYAVPYGIEIDKLIHLYDYLHDYNAGIAFMDEVIKYHTNHKYPNHRSAHAKDVVEYTRVKQAWELDKKTGQHGHLQDVIKTSDIISW